MSDVRHETPNPTSIDLNPRIPPQFPPPAPKTMGPQALLSSEMLPTANEEPRTRSDSNCQRLGRKGQGVYVPGTPAILKRRPDLSYPGLRVLILIFNFNLFNII